MKKASFKSTLAIHTPLLIILKHHSETPFYNVDNLHNDSDVSNLVYLKEPSFFCLVKFVEIRPPLSRSDSMMTPLAKSFLISVFMIFISCSLWGILGADVIPGLSLKLIFRPFLIISGISLSLVIFLPYSAVIFLNYQLEN